MKTKFFLFFSLMVFTAVADGQTNLQQFFQLASRNDTIEELKFLNKWESSAKDDPDLYIAWFNYYFQKSMTEVIMVNRDTTKQNGFKISDPVTQKRVGSMYSEVTYNPDTIAKAIEYIDKGIEKYPARLDMRFGKVYAYGKIEDYKSYTEEIIRAIEYSDIIKNKWIWKDTKPLENSEEGFLYSIQDYQVQIFNTNKDSLLPYMAMIAKSVLKYYPDNIVSINDLSIVYMIQKDYKNALEVLIKAEKLAPTDCIVLGNLAQAYNYNGDKKNAVRCLEKIIKIGNKDEKAQAQKLLREIDN